MAHFLINYEQTIMLVGGEKTMFLTCWLQQPPASWRLQSQIWSSASSFKSGSVGNAEIKNA